jgi:hypothetical protein
VLFGCTVTDITTESDGTYTLTFEHDGELGTCQANYVLGCDGANRFSPSHPPIIPSWCPLQSVGRVSFF